METARTGRHRRDVPGPRERPGRRTLPYVALAGLGLMAAAIVLVLLW